MPLGGVNGGRSGTRIGHARSDPIWKAVDYDTMTDLPGLADRLVGKPKVATGLPDCLLQAWIGSCIRSKKVIKMEHLWQRDVPTVGMGHKDLVKIPGSNGLRLAPMQVVNV